jgi:hypothetical protein
MVVIFIMVSIISAIDYIHFSFVVPENFVTFFESCQNLRYTNYKCVSKVWQLEKLLPLLFQYLFIILCILKWINKELEKILKNAFLPLFQKFTFLSLLSVFTIEFNLFHNQK